MTDKMPEDLRWLAENVSEWYPEWAICDDPKDALIRVCGSGKKERYCGPNSISARDPLNNLYTRDQWQAARQQIEKERMDIIGHNGNSGAHYDSVMTPEEQEEYGPKPSSKYHVEIRPGVWVDVYDVLHAFRVTNPGDQHALKKLLKPGQRGYKDANQDRREAVDSIFRAIELESDNGN